MTIKVHSTEAGMFAEPLSADCELLSHCSCMYHTDGYNDRMNPMLKIHGVTKIEIHGKFGKVTEIVL